MPILLLGPAIASEPSPEAGGGSGLSYWGPIPPPADSLTLAYVKRPKPTWERTLYVPYAVIKFPFSLLYRGTKGVFVFVDDRGWVDFSLRLTHRFPLFWGLQGKLTAGGLSGVGVGLDFTHDAFLGPGNDMVITARVSVLEARGQKYTFSSHFRAEEATSYLIAGGYTRRPELHFYGIGPQSQPQDEAVYDRELYWGGLGLSWRLGEVFRLTGSAIYSSVFTTDSALTDDDRSIAEVFGEAPPGFGDRDHGVSGKLSFSRDTTPDTGRPDRGSVEQLEVAYFWDGTGDLADFWSYRANVERYFPLWNSGQALALRGILGWLESRQREGVAFARLYDHDNPDRIRAFRNQRWYDLGIVIGTVEYRWPLWANTTPKGLGLDLALFTDIGQVFGDFQQIGGGNLQGTYGLGLRMINTAGGFSASLEWSRSEEGNLFKFQFDQMFQQVRWAFLRGSDHVALR